MGLIVCNVCRKKSHKGFSTILCDGIKDEFEFVKELNSSFNFGVDQLICHNAKWTNLLKLSNLFTPNNMKGELMYSDYSFDNETATYIEKGKFNKPSKACLYFCCGVVNNKIKDWNVRCSHNEKIRQYILNTKSGYSSLLSILIFRSIFGVNDTNYSNILFDDEKNIFYSIDENCIGTIPPQVFWGSSNSKIRQITRELENSSLDKCAKRECCPHWIKNPDSDEILRMKQNVCNFVSKYQSLFPSQISSEVVVRNFDQCFEIVLDMYTKI